MFFILIISAILLQIKTTHYYSRRICRVYNGSGQVQDNLITEATLYNPILSSIDLIKYVEDTDEVHNVKCF